MTEPWEDAHAALAFGAVALDNLHNGGHPNMIEHVATLRSTIEGLTAERDWLAAQFAFAATEVTPHRRYTKEEALSAAKIAVKLNALCAAEGSE